MRMKKNSGVKKIWLIKEVIIGSSYNSPYINMNKLGTVPVLSAWLCVLNSENQLIINPHYPYTKPDSMVFCLLQGVLKKNGKFYISRVL